MAARNYLVATLLATCLVASADVDHPGLRNHLEFLIVLVTEQTLYHYREKKLFKMYPISTSEYGIGSRVNSNKTPLGLHLIRAKYGDGAPLGMRFIACKSTGEISPIFQDERRSKTEDILTRIMHLHGLEPSVNQGDGVDSI